MNNPPSELSGELSAALAAKPELIRTLALEQSLHYAICASEAVVKDGAQAPRAHVTALAHVSQAWATLANALTE